MVRTQIQLPDELYERMKRFATARELSMAEVARRGLEDLLRRYPEPESADPEWQIPRTTVGTVQVSLEDLRNVAVEDETNRSR